MLKIGFLMCGIKGLSGYF